MIRSRHTRPLTLVLAALGCLSIAAAAAAQPDGAPTSHRWGVNNDHIVTGPPPDEFGRLPEGDVLLRARESGLGWVRYVLFWNLANPAPGTFNWTHPDQEIARMRAAGLNVLVQAVFPPTWTTGATHPNEQTAYYCLDETRQDGVRQVDDCLDPERRPGFGLPAGQRSQHFRAFVREAVSRYRGQVQAWGFGVEFHNKVFWRGTPDQLFDEVLRPGYEEVKALDPGALVVGPDEDIEDVLEGLLLIEQRRGVRAFDVLAFHAFKHSGWNDPVQLDVEWRGNSRGIDCTFEVAGGDQKLCSLENIVERYGRGRPLWMTEVGYRIDDPFVPDAAARQQACLQAWIDGIKARPWIDKAFFYRLMQTTTVAPGDFGLFMNDAPRTAVPAWVPLGTALAAQPLPVSSYLAEGSTANLFDLDVLVANPTSQPAPVKLTVLSDGGRVDTLTDTLPPASRRTYGIGRTHMPELSSSGGVSTIVESTQGVPLAVERTMFWNKSQRYGGHGGTSVAQPERRWYFAEGSQGFFDTFVLLANSGNTTATVRLTFLLDGEGVEPVVLTREVDPQSRFTFWALEDERLIDQSFAIVVDADVPIIAERAMYFGQRFVWPGGHESAGVPALATRWFHAEGATGPTFDEYILVGNPNDASTDLTVTFLLRDGGPPIVGTKTVAKRSRFTLNVEYAALFLDGLSEADAQRLLSAEVSVQVESTEPVVSERAMYWPGSFLQWTEAHNSFGTTDTGTAWALAEGRNGGPRGFSTYILLANPSNEAATVRVTFLKPDGSPSQPVVKIVPANARENVQPHEMPAGEFGALVESTNGVPIVVERAMYWVVGGRPLGGGTNATAVRLR